MIKMNCIFIKNVSGCTNENVKRSLFGIGPRLCVSYGELNPKCGHCVKHQKPSAVPPAPKVKL